MATGARSTRQASSSWTRSRLRCGHALAPRKTCFSSAASSAVIGSEHPVRRGWQGSSQMPILRFARSSQHSLIGVLLMLFSSRMISEVVQPFWAAVQRGEFITEAAESVGTYREMGGRWIAAAGGVRPRRGRDLQGRYLSFSEREEIAVGRAAGESVRSIARRLGRSPATVSRELRRGCLTTNAHCNASRAAVAPGGRWVALVPCGRRLRRRPLCKRVRRGIGTIPRESGCVRPLRMLVAPRRGVLSAR
jgi:hypothetical protein